VAGCEPRSDGARRPGHGCREGRGIGVAAARLLAERGSDIFFTYWQAYDRSQAWGAEEDRHIRIKLRLKWRVCMVSG